jgi:hypothetical protein
VKKLFVLLFLPLLLLTSSPAEAAVNARVRVENQDRTIFDKVISIPDGCLIRDTNDKLHQISGAKAICALDTASKAGNFNYEFQSSSVGLFLLKIDSNNSSEDEFWLYRINNRLAPVGMADYTVSANDYILVGYGSDPLLPLKVEVDNTSINNNQDLAVTTKVWDENQGDFKPIGDSTVVLGGVKYQSGSDGKVVIHSPVAGEVELYAEKPNYIRSEKVLVKILPANAEEGTETKTGTTVTTPTPSPTVIQSQPTTTPVPTSPPQVSGTADTSLPKTGPIETGLSALLFLLTGLYLRGKRFFIP